MSQKRAINIVKQLLQHCSKP